MYKKNISELLRPSTSKAIPLFAALKIVDVYDVWAWAPHVKDTLLNTCVANLISNFIMIVVGIRCKFIGYFKLYLLM
jgi:hypothetical protein